MYVCLDINLHPMIYHLDMPHTKQFLIFTDLDGTLLDYNTYSIDQARDALQFTKDLMIPIVAITSKTRHELENKHYTHEFFDIFATENGSAIYIPKNNPLSLHAKGKDIGQYLMIQIGEAYKDILVKIDYSEKKTGIKVKRFSTMSTQEISELSGLDLRSAAMAKKREFSEPFVYNGDDADLERFVKELNLMGLECIKGGRFYHVVSKGNKGHAVKIIENLYKENYTDKKWKTVALGDSYNDVPLLMAVDVPVLMPHTDGTYIEIPEELERITIKAVKPGPEGWSMVIMDLLRKEGFYG